MKLLLYLSWSMHLWLKLQTSKISTQNILRASSFRNQDFVKFTSTLDCVHIATYHVGIGIRLPTIEDIRIPVPDSLSCLSAPNDTLLREVCEDFWQRLQIMNMKQLQQQQQLVLKMG